MDKNAQRNIGLLSGAQQNYAIHIILKLVKGYSKTMNNGYLPIKLPFYSTGYYKSKEFLIG